MHAVNTLSTKGFELNTLVNSVVRILSDENSDKHIGNGFFIFPSAPVKWVLTCRHIAIEKPEVVKWRGETRNIEESFYLDDDKYDVALLELERPFINDSKAISLIDKSYFNLDSYKSDDFFMKGYYNKVNDDLDYNTFKSGSLDGLRPIWLFNATNKKSLSGSPICIDLFGQPFVVAINTGRTEDKALVGFPVLHIIKWLKKISAAYNSIPIIRCNEIIESFTSYIALNGDKKFLEDIYVKKDSLSTDLGSFKKRIAEYITSLSREGVSIFREHLEKSFQNIGLNDFNKRIDLIYHSLRDTNKIESTSTSESTSESTSTSVFILTGGRGGSGKTMATTLFFLSLSEKSDEVTIVLDINTTNPDTFRRMYKLLGKGDTHDLLCEEGQYQFFLTQQENLIFIAQRDLYSTNDRNNIFNIIDILPVCIWKNEFLKNRIKNRKINLVIDTLFNINNLKSSHPEIEMGKRPGELNLYVAHLVSPTSFSIDSENESHNGYLQSIMRWYAWMEGQNDIYFSEKNIIWIFNPFAIRNVNRKKQFNYPNSSSKIISKKSDDFLLIKHLSSVFSRLINDGEKSPHRIQPFDRIYNQLINTYTGRPINSIIIKENILDLDKKAWNRRTNQKSVNNVIEQLKEDLEPVYPSFKEQFIRYLEKVN